MIYLFTDFGYAGPYVGQMKSVLLTENPSIPVIDLMHDAPNFNPVASAYLLAAVAEVLPRESIVLAVVDPGVGHPQRRPVLIQADGRWLVGPGNGLFDVMVQRSIKVKCWEIVWRPDHLSTSFHGRDLFAPTAAMLAKGQLPASKELSKSECLQRELADDLPEVIYIDQYGNCMTGVRGDAMDKARYVHINARQLAYADTFSAVERNEPFWYINSNGLLEIAVNQGNAAKQLGIQIGQQLSIE